MPDVNSYTFSHKELLELMVKEAGVHEGKWQLQINFGFSAGNFGPDDEHMSPGSISVVNHIGITKALDGSPPALVVDAAQVNPSPT